MIEDDSSVKTDAVVRRSSGVTLAALRAFVAVVEKRSFSLAAQALGVTQPSISAQLAALESTCGVLLCHRKPEISLTQAGEELFVRARLVLGRVDEFESAAGAARAAVDARLSIGTSAPHLALPLVAGFRSLHPRARLAVSIGNTTTLLDDVARCRVDIGIMTLLDPAPHLACALVASPRLAVCMRRDDPLAGRIALSPAELAGRAFVLREPGSQTRQLLEAAFSADAVPLVAAMELATREAMREAVAAGIGLGALFEGESGHDARFVNVPFRSLPCASGVYAVALRDSLGIPAVQAFFDHVATVGRVGGATLR
jgi:DNA-binding transcriptional LysR family regulator